MGVTQRIDPHIITQAKRTRLSDVIGRHVHIRKAGSAFIACCPFHKEKSPSFFIYPDHYHCFGCGAHGDAIDFLVKIRGIDFQEAINELTSGAAFRSSADSFMDRQRQASDEYAANDAGRFDSDAEERRRLHEARAIWTNRKALKGTIAEKYLREIRNIRPPYPLTLAFAPALYYGPARREFPALLAALEDRDGIVTAVQRIYLDPETGKKAEPARQAKRTKGAMRDGAVKLGRAGSVLGIAEGVETALSAQRIYSLPVWAALGAQRMKAISLPPDVSEVMIFRDNGETGFKEAVAAAEKFEADGRRVMIEPPPAEFKDWNELLMARGARG